MPEDRLLKGDLRALTDEPRPLPKVGEEEAGQDEADAGDLDCCVGELLRDQLGDRSERAHA